MLWLQTPSRAKSLAISHAGQNMLLMPKLPSIGSLPAELAKENQTFDKFFARAEPLHFECILNFRHYSNPSFRRHDSGPAARRRCIQPPIWFESVGHKLEAQVTGYL